MSKANTQKTQKEKLPEFPKKLKREFFELLRVQSNSQNEVRMVLYITKKLEGWGIPYEVDAFGNILVTKGEAEIYPAIVSHMDTVHEIKDDFYLYTEKKMTHEIVAAGSKKYKTGVGGDDKCGIYACLYALRRFQNIKAAFFTSEEVGCVGSSAVKKEWFDNVGYIIQLDRWGREDFICEVYQDETVSKEFLEKSAPLRAEFGYKPTSGLMTDSITLWGRGIGLSAINLSCGYYEHHSNSENIDLNEFWNSLRFTENLIHVLGENKYPSKPKPVDKVRDIIKDTTQSEYDDAYFDMIMDRLSPSKTFDIYNKKLLRKSYRMFNQYYDSEKLTVIPFKEFEDRLVEYLLTEMDKPEAKRIADKKSRKIPKVEDFKFEGIV